MSVEPRPAASTSAPWLAAPRRNAAASGAEEARMSCTVRIVAAPVSFANAAPTASATPSSSWSGTTPLMSYALTMLARSPTLDPPSVTRTAPCLYRTRPGPSLSVLRRPGTQHPQVAAAADLDALADRLFFLLRRPGLGFHDRLGERLEVIFTILRRIRGQPDHVPAARGGQPTRVLFAQVIAVRLERRRQRAGHSGV